MSGKWTLSHQHFNVNFFFCFSIIRIKRVIINVKCEEKKGSDHVILIDLITPLVIVFVD